MFGMFSYRLLVITVSSVISIVSAAIFCLLYDLNKS